MTALKKKLPAAMAGVMLWGCAADSVYSAREAADPAAVAAANAARVEAAVTPHLLRLMDERRLASLAGVDQAGAIKQVRALTTPAGYRLRYRYAEPVVPVIQALALTKETQLQARLLEAARWNVGGALRDPRARGRAVGLLVLAEQKNPEHFKIFREAILDNEVSVQFAAVEALEAWNQPQAIPLLLGQSATNWSALIRVYAAEAAWRMGSSQGREIVLRSLKDTSWVVRAMAARAIGELGKGEDAEAVIARISPEREHVFVAAELCIAGLKLLAKRLPAPAPAPAPRPAPRPAASPSDLFELEPLVVTAPRMQMGRQLVDVRVDNSLVTILEQLAQSQPDEDTFTDPVLTGELSRLVTPKGFGFNIRYTDISYLLTEGLAGTANLTLVTRLETIARSTRNNLAKALALVALGYDQTRQDLSIFRDAMKDSDVRVRFGVAEALAAQSNPMAKSYLAELAQADESLVVRLFAAQSLAQKGDIQGVETLRRYLGDPDPIVNAVATYYLGGLGNETDLDRLLIQLQRDSNDLLTAENCLAVLRLVRP